MIYCLYGEDYKKIDEYINEIVKKENIENITTYDTSLSSIDEIITECNYMDMFGSKKLIIANGCDFLTGKESLEDETLNNYINKPNEENILVLKVIDSKLDERKKIVKLIKEKCTVKSFNLPSEKEMPSYIKEYIKEKDYKIDETSVQEIVRRININTTVLNKELEKLLLYKGDNKNIEINDVKNVICEYDKEDLIFDLSEGVTTKNIEKIFSTYEKLKKSGNEPIALIALISGQLRLILNVKILMNENKSEKEIVDLLKEHPYRITLAIKQSRNLTIKKLYELLNLLYELDLKIKKGQIEKYEGLEAFFLNLTI